MGFLTGSTTFRRFSLEVPALTGFDERHLEALTKRGAGRTNIIVADGISYGHTAGEHLYDQEFTLEKNRYDNCLWWSVRYDRNKLPADLLKAYTAIDLAAISKNNPSGRPTSRQKREAKESARDRLEQEAKDGRFIKRKLVEVLWDCQFSEILYGETSEANTERFLQLFKATFNLEPEPINAATQARVAAGRLGLAERLASVHPTTFVNTWGRRGNGGHDDVAWSPFENSPTWLGNEFLVWLWWLSDTEKGVDIGGYNNSVGVLLSSGVKLQCPKGMKGDDTCRSEFPATMPEAMTALRDGKLPRKAGLQLALSTGDQFGFVLHAETLAVSGLKVPAPEEEDAHAKKCARIESVRECVQVIRLMYERFVELRLGPHWERTVTAIREWVG